MGISLEQFVEQLTQSGLLSAAEVSTFQQALPAPRRPQDAEGLARELVQARRLTRYQAAAVAQGKAKSLVFDEYVILDKLGQGGMGVVLKAEHRRMKRQVAIKIIAPSVVKSPEAVRRFYREVEAAARLSHPNIVAAHDAREYHGSHCLVMEYVEGKDLAAIVKEHGPLPVRQAVECIVQAARGLEFAHKRGVVHRDIKPANLLLDREGTVKILDMGLARVAGLGDEAEGERLTQSGQVMGTCDYMAPEQSLDTHKADHRADVYSLGCTLYRLLTNKTPYAGETYAKLFMAHLNDPIPSIRDVRADVPAEVDAAFSRMVAKQAEDRYQSMTEVIAALERCLGGQQPADEESLTNGALAFLRDMTEGGTATRQRVQSRVEETMAPQAHPETGTNLGLAPPNAGRKRLVIGLALAGAAVVACCGVIITLRHGSGKSTTIQVPDGSQVAIGRDGQVDVTPPGAAGGSSDAEMQRYEKRWGIKRHDDVPGTASSGGFDPQRANSSRPLTAAAVPGERPGVRAASPFIGPDGNWRLPSDAPPLAVAPFDAQKARAHQEAWAKYLGLPVEMTNSIGMKFVLIPPGEFMMGSTPEEIQWALDQGKSQPAGYFERVESEGPACRVRISRPFYCGMCEVTQSQYVQVVGSNPSAFAATGKDRDLAKPVAGQDTRQHPVETVSWNDAVAYCQRLSATDAERAAGRAYLLPTEAQWEYASRAGTTGLWFFSAPSSKPSDALEPYGWFLLKSSQRTTHPVGQKKPSPWGLYDVLGNVSEYCSDRPDWKRRAEAVRIDPLGDPQGTTRAARGGDYASSLYFCRMGGYRLSPAPNNARPQFGFRVICEIDLSKTPLGAARPVGDPAQKTNASLSAGVMPVATTASPYAGPDGNWRLPPDAPPPAIAPFDAKKAREHQEAWAKYLKVPLEMSNSVGMRFILIPPGEYDMGATPKEIAAMIKADVGFKHAEARQKLVQSAGPKHRVRITRPFYMSRFEVTQAVYLRAMGTNPSSFSDQSQAAAADDSSLSESVRKDRENDRKRVAGQDTGQQPVETVSWEQAGQFAEILGAMPAERSATRDYRLPTEAEWEYACRAGTTGLWPCGTEDRLAEIAWHGMPADRPHPVGVKQPNAWGLFDMVGNVFEWCQDWHVDGYYAKSPVADPAGPSTGQRRVARGGAWFTESYLSHSALRFSFGQASGHQVGFRVVSPIASPPH